MTGKGPGQSEAGTDFLTIRGLVKRFGATAAVDGVSFAIPQGSLLALLGPSGSGKTTTLRLLAGFEQPDAGSIHVDGQDVTRLRPVSRRFGMVFQHFALFPHLDVAANVGFGLESQGVKREELHRRVEEALALVELAGFGERAIGQLSGGQQQRVALARAIAPAPRVLLLDEPLSNLDPALRERTRHELRLLLKRIGITTVLVTHEQEEAFDLGEVIALMRDGRLEQLGTPEVLYDSPGTPFVARFIGRSTTLRVEVIGPVPGQDIGVRVRVGRSEWIVPRPPGGQPPATGTPADLLLRPESLRFTGDAGALRGEVVNRRYTGAAAFFGVRVEEAAGGETAIVEVSAAPDAARPGDLVGLEPSGRGLHLFPDA